MADSTDLMRLWHDTPRRRDDVVTIPRIWLMVILSLAIHLAALWEFLPELKHSLSPGEDEKVAAIGERLAVRLAPPQMQPPSLTVIAAASRGIAAAQAGDGSACETARPEGDTGSRAAAAGPRNSSVASERPTVPVPTPGSHTAGARADKPSDRRRSVVVHRRTAA
jgi:hypothetical protein